MPYIVHSQLPAEQYRQELRACLGWKIPFMGDCLNGIVIGNFFSVAYYSPYEWNRRITRECNRAIGYVKRNDQGTEVHFVRSKGLCSPMWVSLLLILWGGVGAAAYGIWPGVLFGLALTAAVCGISALQSSITEQGVADEQVIIMFLTNPKEFYYC